MTKIAIITDSNSGISQTQATILGIHILPMPFMINEDTYYEDITLSNQSFYEKLAEGADISTSQPSPEAVTKLWDELLKENDEIIHIPMSSGLSGSYETAYMLSKDYVDKVYVVNNQRISVTQRQSAMDALELVKNGKNANEIKLILEEEKLNSSIYVMLNTLFYLKKGGRITPTAAALGTILKIKPVLQIQGDKLDAFAKARTITQAKSIMINAIKNDINNRFGGNSNNVHLEIAHTQNETAAEVLKLELLKEFPNSEIVIDHLSLSVACHIGDGALAVACSKKIIL
ncbi:MAG TPA: DegV family protein [Lachnospiraceae bacterium]|nr:DegV family protein [Lachnospiraceae bacterium]